MRLMLPERGGKVHITDKSHSGLRRTRCGRDVLDVSVAPAGCGWTGADASGPDGIPEHRRCARCWRAAK